ncbi:MAG: ribonuclease PH [Nitrospirota bacterium]
MSRRFQRADGRAPHELRPVRVARRFIRHAEGSVLIEMGETKVICTATIEQNVPPFLRNQGRGWVTGEYAMLPRATMQRTMREAARGRIGGRTHEIQRLIGRSLRGVVDLAGLGERTILLDCDVIQADGGTRTAAITGAFIALVDACEYGRAHGFWSVLPVKDYVAAVSVGVIDGRTLLDLAYVEDAAADVDMNVVMTGGGRFIEVQGTAERTPFADRALGGMLRLAKQGIRELMAMQRKQIGKVMAHGAGALHA